MIKEIAFVGTPVTDVKRARAFYEDVLGLRPTTDEPEAKWIEYEIGSGTFAIGSYGDQWKPGVANSGTMVAFEIDDLDEMMERVKKSGATAAMDLMDSPVCRFGVVLDPDGNAVMLHKRNES